MIWDWTVPWFTEYNSFIVVTSVSIYIYSCTVAYVVSFTVITCITKKDHYELLEGNTSSQSQLLYVCTVYGISVAPVAPMLLLYFWGGTRQTVHLFSLCVFLFCAYVYCFLVFLFFYFVHLLVILKSIWVAVRFFLCMLKIKIKKEEAHLS